MTKTPYVAPVFRAHGKIEAVTKGGSDGNFTDQAFPAGTLLDQLTFS